MKSELRKIWKDPRLCILLMAVVIVNAVGFYLYCTKDLGGYTLSDIQPLYAQADTMEQTQAELDEKLELAILSMDDKEISALQTQRNRNQGALDRILQAKNYPQHRQDLIMESEIKIMLGLFGAEDSFEVRSLRRGIEVYNGLEEIVPQAVFLGSAEVLTSYQFTDWLLLVFIVTAGLILLTQEKGLGLLNLTQPTKYGPSRLYWRRWLAAVVLLGVGFVAMYGSNGVIAGALFGFENLSVPVQALFGFANCPWAISVGEMLAAMLGLKFLWALVCLSVVFLFCAGTGSGAVAVVKLAACAASAVWLENSNDLWLRTLSVSRFGDCGQFFREPVYLNFFGYPADRLAVAVVLFLLLGAVCVGIGFVLFPRSPHGRLLLPGISLHRGHTNLFFHEWRKCLVTWKGIWVLVALVGLQVVCYRDYRPLNTEYEYYYRTYSAVLSGAPSGEKDAYLQEQQEHFNDLYVQLADIAMRYPDQQSFYRESEQVRLELRAEEAFMDAKQQYDALMPGQSYLYQTGYRKLLGEDAPKEAVLNFCKAFLVLILLLCPMFAQEKQSGMDILQTASRNAHRISRHKTVIWLVFALTVTCIAFLPRYCVVVTAYGGLDRTAQANSITLASQLPDFLTVGGLFAFLLLSKLLIVTTAAWTVCQFSKRSPNTIIATILAAAVLLIPTGAAFLLCTI